MCCREKHRITLKSCAMCLCLFRYPAQHSRNIGHVEAIRRRTNLKRSVIGRLNMNTPDRVQQEALRHIKKSEHIAEEDPCSAYDTADAAVAFQHEDAHAERCGDTGETQTCETGSHDDRIIVIALLVGREGHGVIFL